ncbi:MAG: DUF4139 domain-containing protein [Armatimonadetes bacterium]|nr:DUF4139 domain-containing protein [Armatimonadota bacterium]
MHVLRVSAVLMAFGLASGARAEVSVALSPPRAAVSLVVYGNADITLVREVRTVLLPAGTADVSVEWPAAAVDGSSLSLRAPEGVTVSAPAQPPGKREAMRWRLTAQTPGPRDLEITYLTSGIDWKPYYRLTLDEAGGAVELEGLVELRNRSGQEFEGPEVRLVVGELRLIENLADAAWKTLPAYRDQRKNPPSAAGSGLSERYVYDIGSPPRLTLEDTYTASFLAKIRLTEAQILYRLHPAKYGDGVHRVVVFGNTPEAGLGEIPVAGADAQVMAVTPNGTLPQPSAKVPYTPIGEECEIDLGATPDVAAERRVMKQQRTNFEFDRFDQVEGYDEREWVEVELQNYGTHPVTVEYTDTVPGVWDVAADVPYVEEGMNEVTFRVDLAPQGKETLSYRLIKRQGRRVRLGPVRPK